MNKLQEFIVESKEAKNTHDQDQIKLFGKQSMETDTGKGIQEDEFVEIALFSA